MIGERRDGFQGGGANVAASSFSLAFCFACGYGLFHFEDEVLFDVCQLCVLIHGRIDRKLLGLVLFPPREG